jgi:hypothetical protein
MAAARAPLIGRPRISLRCDEQFTMRNTLRQHRRDVLNIVTLR